MCCGDIRGSSWCGSLMEKWHHWLQLENARVDLPKWGHHLKHQKQFSSSATFSVLLLRRRFTRLPGFPLCHHLSCVLPGLKQRFLWNKANSLFKDGFSKSGDSGRDPGFSFLVLNFGKSFFHFPILKTVGLEYSPLFAVFTVWTCSLVLVYKQVLLVFWFQSFAFKNSLV